MTAQAKALTSDKQQLDYLPQLDQARFRLIAT
jgi:hypothetical protein